MITKRDGESPVQIDGAALFVALGVGLIGASSAVGVPVGLGLETPGSMVLLAVLCFAGFVIGLYAVVAVFTRRLPLPEIRYRGKIEEVIEPEPGPRLTDSERQEAKEQQDIMTRALIEDSRNLPERAERGDEGLEDDR